MYLDILLASFLVIVSNSFWRHFHLERSIWRDRLVPLLAIFFFGSSIYLIARYSWTGFGVFVLSMIITQFVAPVEKRHGKKPFEKY